MPDTGAPTPPANPAPLKLRPESQNASADAWAPADPAPLQRPEPPMGAAAPATDKIGSLWPEGQPVSIPPDPGFGADASTRAAVAEAYFQWHLPKLCPKSRVEIRRDIGLFLREMGGERAIGPIRRFDQLRGIGSHPEWQSPGTRKDRAARIGRMSSWAMETELTTRHPC
jgi:hypothetical protein